MRLCSANVLASINQAAARDCVMCNVKHIRQRFPTVHCQTRCPYDEGSLPCENCMLEQMPVTSLCQVC